MPSPAEFSRYHRQMLVPGFGVDGQARLASASALIVGCGALGTVIADVLARAGVGTLILVDRDIVETTNLQRQVLFDEADAAAGLPKAEAAAARLGAVNSGIRIVPIVADVTARNAESLIAGGSGGWPAPSVVLDGTDNFETRYLLNDVCVKRAVPLVYGGAVATGGMTMTIIPIGERPTPCLRCVFPDPPPTGSTPTCDTAGILAPASGIVANMQAAEALKVLIGRADLGATGLRMFDLWTNTWRTIDTGEPRRADGPAENKSRSPCPCCGLGRYEFLDRRTDGSAVLCGADAVQITPPTAVAIDLDAAAALLANHGAVVRSRHMLRSRLEAERVELTLFPDGRAIVRGTREPTRARAIYARFVGA